MVKRSVNAFADIARKVRGTLFRHEDGLLRGLLTKTDDDDLAHLIDSAAAADKVRLFRALESGRRGKVLNELSEYSSEAVLARLSKDEVRAIVDSVQSDLAVDIIQWLDPPMRARIIADLRRHDPHVLLPLLVFGEETAGGRMKTEIHAFGADTAVGDVRRSLAKEARPAAKTAFIYATDREGRYLGRFSPIRLLQAGDDAPIRSMMRTEIEPVPATMDQEDVALAFDEQDAIELPVVNAKGKLLGVITADDVFEVMEQEYAEDVSRLSGVSADAHITDPVFLAARRRMPWLGVNLVTATVAAAVVSLFRDTISRTVILAAFMPIVAGIGGNAAQQALAVTIRAIAFGDIEHVSAFRAIAKEVLVGTLNGAMLGTVMGFLAFWWTGSAAIGVVIALAMTLNLFAAGLAAVAVPLVMKALRTDPALASTVFVTATTDIFGFFVFLGLASVLL